MEPPALTSATWKSATVALVGVLAGGPALSCGAATSDAPCEPTHERNNVVDGIKTIASAFGPKDTIDRLEAAVRGKGMVVFARIDHAAGAAEVGLSLRSTELLIFGSARAGTPLMQARQTIGLDLPLKALVWQDASGKTWLSYNDPLWVLARHGGDDGLNRAVGEMAAGLTALTTAATR
jgi:uncharacterized protein (DUF302 family)